MKKIIKLIPCTLFLMTPLISNSQSFFSGNEIYGKLNGSDFEKQLAIGYIAGVTDVLVGNTICFKGQKINLGQLNDIVEKYLREHPEVRGFSAFSNVGAALQKAFPCNY